MTVLVAWKAWRLRRQARFECRVAAHRRVLASLSHSPVRYALWYVTLTRRERNAL